MSRFDPASYPGTRPPGPTLLYSGQTFPARVGPTVDAPIDVPTAASGAPVLDGGVVRWIVAFGSNASPDRLFDKALDVRGAILLPALLRGWRTAWEARRSATGAVPLTLVPAPGHVLSTWALGLHRDDLAALDTSESRGTNYVVGRVGDLALGARFHLRAALAYGPAASTRVLASGPDLACHPALDQAAATALLDGVAVSVAADPLPEPLTGDWPETPLEDLPLFVYGTLQPGRSGWGRIADLVEVVGEVAVAGTAVATFYGWPAASFGGDARLHGCLVRPVDPEAARDLYRVCDVIEDAPRLFRRVAVLAWDGATPCWAAAYEWNEAQGPPPGEPIPDGRWTDG